MQHGLSALSVAATCAADGEEKVKLLLAFGGSPEVPVSPRIELAVEEERAAIARAAAKRLAAFAIKHFNSLSRRRAPPPQALSLETALEAAGSLLGTGLVVTMGQDPPALLQATARKDLKLVSLWPLLVFPVVAPGLRYWLCRCYVADPTEVGVSLLPIGSLW